MSENSFSSNGVANEESEAIDHDNEAIAIIGLAGRFPDAHNIDEFWQNLLDGHDAIKPFSEEQLVEAGLDVDAVRKDPSYITQGSFLGDAGYFDANLFGYNPQEAMLLDPQHRLLLEVSWQALEMAGYNTGTGSASIGVNITVFPSIDICSRPVCRYCLNIWF